MYLVVKGTECERGTEGRGWGDEFSFEVADFQGRDGHSGGDAE